jgi:anti-sigma factor RsiW
MKQDDQPFDYGVKPRGGRSGEPEAECPFALRVNAYYDGELAGQAREEVERHIEGCQSCSEQLKDLHRLSQLIGQAPSPAVPDGFLERLHAGVGSARRQVIVRIAWPALAAAATLLIAFSVLLWQTAGARGRSAERGTTWEIAVASFKAQAPADVGPEELVTQLIVRGLSGEGTHD